MSTPTPTPTHTAVQPTLAAVQAKLSPCAASQWISVDERLPEKFTEVLIAFAENTLPSTGQYTDNPNDHDGWCYPRENLDWTDGSHPTVTHWASMRHPSEMGQVDRGESSSEGGES